MLRTSIVQRMSTPPFVTLPRGVQRTDFVGGHAHLSGLIAYPDSESRGTILLIPGFTGSKEDFIALIPYLRDLGYTVASYDQRGQFESPGPDATDGYAMARSPSLAHSSPRLNTRCTCSVTPLVGSSRVRLRSANLASRWLRQVSRSSPRSHCWQVGLRPCRVIFRSWPLNLCPSCRTPHYMTSGSRRRPRTGQTVGVRQMPKSTSSCGIDSLPTTPTHCRRRQRS